MLLTGTGKVTLDAPRRPPPPPRPPRRLVPAPAAGDLCRRCRRHALRSYRGCCETCWVNLNYPLWHAGRLLTRVSHIH
jgi:hypothetical protein